MSNADINHTEQEMYETTTTESFLIEGNGFRMSGTIGQLAKALSQAQLELTGAVKDSTNPFFKSSYADLASVLEAMKPLHKYGLAIVQMPIEGEGKVKLVTTLLHSSGEWMQSTYAMTPVKNDPQGIGSCLTYMRRYAASAFAGIAQVDDDGNAASAPQPKKDLGKPSSGIKEQIESSTRYKDLKLVADKVDDLMAENQLELAANLIDANCRSPEEMTYVADTINQDNRRVIKTYMQDKQKRSRDAAAKTAALRAQLPQGDANQAPVPGLQGAIGESK